MLPVTIYTTPTCGYCKATKAYFKEHNVEYTEHDVTTDAAALEEMMKLSGQQGVPFIIIGEGDSAQHVLGFDQPKIAQILGISA